MLLTGIRLPCLSLAKEAMLGLMRISWATLPICKCSVVHGDCSVQVWASCKMNIRLCWCINEGCLELLDGLHCDGVRSSAVCRTSC